MPKNLTLVKPETVTGQQPPHALGKYGRSLWDRMTREYNVSDGAGIEMLYQLAPLHRSPRCCTKRSSVMGRWSACVAC